MKTVLVVGAGEVGTSVKELYLSRPYKVLVYDKYKKDLSTISLEEVKEVKVDILEVCIPYNGGFIFEVKTLIEAINPTLTIIHSTLGIGTTKTIYDDIHCNIVHSPIMGIHPHLTKSIRTFFKIIGPTTKESATLCEEHYDNLGIKHVTYNNSDESEAAKLLSTTYYAWNIIFGKEVHNLCDDNNLDFDNVYTLTNRIYNEGYASLGKTNVIRPVLNYVPGGISGHCLQQNAKILHEENKFYPALVALETGHSPENWTLPLYQNETWLYSEYYGKDKSCGKIGEEQGVSDVTIGKWLSKFNISIKTRKWSEEEIDILKELSQEMSFKEIADSGLLERTYKQIRNKAYQPDVSLSSVYDPSFRDEETRKKISCSLQGISVDDFDGFLYEKSNRVERKEYSDWRKKVLAKYEYTCQKTGTKGGKLNVHHIIPWSVDEKLRYDENNGIVLSETAHIEFHKKYGYKDCTKEDLYKFLEMDEKDATV